MACAEIMSECTQQLRFRVPTEVTKPISFYSTRSHSRPPWTALTMSVHNQRTDKPHNLERDFVDFIAGLRDEMATYHVKVVIRTELRCNNTKFRAHTNYRGKIWRDWVIIDWIEEGKTTMHVLGFRQLVTATG